MNKRPLLRRYQPLVDAEAKVGKRVHTLSRPEHVGVIVEARDAKDGSWEYREVRVLRSSGRKSKWLPAARFGDLDAYLSYCQEVHHDGIAIETEVHNIEEKIKPK